MIMKMQKKEEEEIMQVKTILYGIMEIEEIKII